ncbi:uncharacterized protein CPUR_00184 [Claviceps purpurea 20.1]|nr:uncharacterized protein CPUR_00184 [Claviceps purpurea 20.1]
MDVFIVS